jgi:hypothetical protein
MEYAGWYNPPFYRSIEADVVLYYAAPPGPINPFGLRSQLIDRFAGKSLVVFCDHLAEETRLYDLALILAVATDMASSVKLGEGPNGVASLTQFAGPVRIKRRTGVPESLFRTLEFCDAVTEFAKPARHSMADVRDIRPFFAFVAQHAKRYPLLAKFNAEFLGKHPPPPPEHLRMSRRAEPVSRGVKMSVVLRFEPPRRPANPWAAAVARAIGGR